MPFVDPGEFSGGLWPRGYRAAGAQYPRKHSPWNSACGATGRTQTVPVLGLIRYAPEHRTGPAGSRTPELPIKACFSNNGQEGSAEIPTPADFITAKRAALESAHIDPGSHSLLKSQMGRGTGPGELDWRGHGRSAVGLEGFDGRSEPTIIGVLPTGGVLIPPGPTAGQK